MSRLSLTDCVDLLRIADSNYGDIGDTLIKLVRDELVARHPLPVEPIDYAKRAEDKFREWLNTNRFVVLPEFARSGNKIALIKRLRTIMQEDGGPSGLKEAKDMVEQKFAEWIYPPQY